MRLLTPCRTDERVVPFARDLAAHGSRTALVTPDGCLSYDDLAAHVDAFVELLGPVRRLVLVAGGNAVETLVAYLGALAGGHPVVLVPADDPSVAEKLIATYDPDVVVRTLGEHRGVVERRAGTAHPDLHPDLALALSTSGSTGSPKLVRLSHTNVQANAESIAEFLDIRPSDRAATTLPFAYSYGLSVVNSHLARGASLLVTDLSVVDTCFWDLFRAFGATSFAGVPHTFELLDRAGFADVELPHLRYVTQAGGRMRPDQVERYARLGEARGWRLFVMYGQTEATARMAYLPPELAAAHPTAVGTPIPGGAISLAPVAASGDSAIGEIVFRGPNVMLGYATTPADLVVGRTVSELRTGDLGRINEHGLLEVVGRTARIAKLFGFRVDLEHLERTLADAGLTCACASDADQRLVVAVEDGADDRGVAALVADIAHVPVGCVSVRSVERLPRLANGKVDHAAVAAMAPAAGPVALAAPRRRRLFGRRRYATTVLAVYEAVFVGRRVRPDSTFVSLGGDSLTYVEMSLRLEAVLGSLPAGWHTTSVAELGALPARSRWGSSVETNVLLRGIAIVLIVGTHANLLNLRGGAHALLAVAGFNFARFQLSSSDRRERLRRILHGAGRVLLPSTVWLAFAAAVSAKFSLANVFLLNGVVGAREWTPAWSYWFVEAIVYITLGLAALLAIPAVHRIEARWPFVFPAALVAVGLSLAYELVIPDIGANRLHTSFTTFWVFALGWAVARARTVPQRLLVTAVGVLALPGFLDDVRRSVIVISALVLLTWTRTFRIPTALARFVGVLAAASLSIYLTHFLVYPHFEFRSPWFATVLSLGAGIAYWYAGSWIGQRANIFRQRHLGAAITNATTRKV